MAFDSETLNLVNQKQCKDFEDYVRRSMQNTTTRLDHNSIFS
jgi:hypothetical protein